CCGNICNQTCVACSAAKKGQGTDGACGAIANTRDPDNECNPGECNGAGACNQSQTPQANGAACTIATQCTSGNCVDGVCCDTTCTGACQGCSAAKKGQGASGTCGPIKYDTDPDEECFGGACSGTGTCKYYNSVACTAGTQCLSSFCVDGVCCSNQCGSTCYACTAAKKGSGQDGTCGVIAANTDPDNECVQECNGAGACIKAPNGATCANGTECTSGYCVDGVCCATACMETCNACNVSGSVGTCSPIPAGQGDTNATTPCATVCDGAGVCNGTGSACQSGIQCPSLICKEGFCESPKPPNGPTKWITTKLFSTDISPSRFEALNTRGSGVAVLGTAYWDYPWQQNWSDTLEGSFDGNGFPSVVSGYDSCGWNAPSPQRPKKFLGRSGVTGYYCRNGLITCSGSWPYGGGQGSPKQIIGANDAGQAGAVVNGGWCNINEPSGPSGLVRYSSAHVLELNQTQIDWADRIVLGPLGEFHVGSATTLTKYDVNAVSVWTKSPTISGTIDSSAWDVDAAGNILIALGFTGSVDYGMGPLTASGPKDLGLVKLDPNGNPVWQKHFGNSTFTLSSVSLSRTGASDMAVAGSYTGTMDFGTGALQGQVFVAKFNSSGNEMWHVNISQGWAGISGDTSGAVYLGSNAIDFGWGLIRTPYITSFGNVGSRSLTVAKFQE
ncbi:MAG TPA: hypothetical protein PK156_44610, partial [Polyangium sp.]|nr:hypothetical protein [Polyangium sp.]